MGVCESYGYGDQATEGAGVTSLLRGESGGVFTGREAQHQNSRSIAAEEGWVKFNTDGSVIGDVVTNSCSVMGVREGYGYG